MSIKTQGEGNRRFLRKQVVGVCEEVRIFGGGKMLPSRGRRNLGCERHYDAVDVRGIPRLTGRLPSPDFSAATALLFRQAIRPSLPFHPHL